jgi:hypothetical protein
VKRDQRSLEAYEKSQKEWDKNIRILKKGRAKLNEKA